MYTNHLIAALVSLSGTDTLYAMNFDYPDNEVCFQLQNNGDTNFVLNSGFMDNGTFCNFNGFNSYGVISMFQMLYPEAGLPPISLFDAWYSLLNSFTGVTAFNNYLSETNTTVYPYYCYVFYPS